MMKLVKRKKGFTLVELLIVIAIISILTIVTVGQFQTARARARDAQRKGDLSNMTKALEMYYADLGVFPDATDINLLLETGGEFKDGDYTYMKVVPTEKKLSTDFCYKTNEVPGVEPTKFGLFGNLEVTSDKDCTDDVTGDIHEYECGGVMYCYGLTSPNTILDEDGTLE
jgi:prepilin-type N-terminal cleavage/methylation domain-containing protein